MEQKDKDLTNQTIIENYDNNSEQNQTVIDSNSPYPVNYNSFKHKSAGCIVTLSGREYKIIECLQVISSEADIYLVEDSTNNQRYIWKSYRYQMEPKSEVIDLLKSFAGNAVINIISFGQDNDHKFFEIQEYAEYGSIADYIKRETSAGHKIDPNFIKEFIKKFNLCLNQIHSKNVIHRDIKPSNILLRHLEPLEIALTDFGISSVTELSLHQTTLSRTIAYSSPESMTGIISKATDYWALGLIILEMVIGKNPYYGMNDKTIMYHLATKHVPYAVEITGEFEGLIKGLLTKNDRKRWQFNEVERWLAGGKDIPVYFEKIENISSAIFDVDKKAYTFNDNVYMSLQELTFAFAAAPETWSKAKIHLKNGYVKKWLEKNENYDDAAKMDELWPESQNNENLFLMKLIAYFNHHLPFLVFGIVLDINSLAAIVGKNITGVSNDTEKEILNILLGSDISLFDYYDSYLKLTNKPYLNNEFYLFLKSLKNYPGLDEKALLSILTILLKPDEFIIPDIVKNVPADKIKFIFKNYNIIINKAEYEKNEFEFIISESIKRDIFSNDTEKYIKSASVLNELSGNLITKAELNHYCETCFLPEQLMQDINNGDCDKFKNAVKFFNECGAQLIKKHEYEEYDKKYIIPDNIKNGIKSDILEEYQKSAIYIGNIDYINLKPGDLKVININGEKFEFVWIPAGSVRLGLVRSRCTAVITKGFWLGKYPVTEKQWKAVTGRNPFEDCSITIEQNDNNPIRLVSYKDVKKNFLQALNLKYKGYGQFRLPTEAEWEYACRAGTKTLYYWGDEIQEGYCRSSAEPCEVFPVGMFKPNAWGLYDMCGNIRQYCSDWYGTYPKGIVIDPKGKAKGDAHVIRGASIYDDFSCYKSGMRFYEKYTRDCGVGFRIVFISDDEQSIN